MQGTLEKTTTRNWITVENAGVQLFGVLHRPTNVENLPVVLILHGFASSKQGSNRCYVTMAEALANEGIAALRFDFRGSGDSEGTLDEASLEDLISDALCVAYSLNDHEDLDATKVGIFGASLGGSIAVQAAAKGRLAKALALWAPVASGELWLRDFLMKHPEFLKTDPRQALGTYRGIKLSPVFREQFAELSTYKTLSLISDLPLLHMHGERDAVISISHQEAFRKTSGSQATFISYPEEEHSLGYAKIFPEVIRETVSFFKEHLA